MEAGAQPTGVRQKHKVQCQFRSRQDTDASNAGIKVHVIGLRVLFLLHSSQCSYYIPTQDNPQDCCGF